MNNKQLKILYIDFSLPYLLANTDFPIGGTAIEWFKWINAFADLGHKVGVLTWKGANKYINKKIKFDLIESYDPNRGIPKLRFFYYRLPLFLKSIFEYKPDVIIQAGANRYAAMISVVIKVLKVPVIFRVVSDMDIDGRFAMHFPFYINKMIHSTIEHSNFISCQNRYQVKVCKRKYPNKIISLHYNPFNIQHENKLEKEEKKYFAWIGNFSYEKNLPALAKVAQNLPEFRFLIAGKGFTNNHPDAEQGLNKLRSLPNVEFIGYLDNLSIPKFLKNAIALINTSRLEGFSNTFLEAWSVGTPVISTMNVNPDNILVKYGIGFVSEDYTGMIELIQKIAKLDHLEMTKLSNRCKKYVKENHNTIKIAKSFIKDFLDSKRINGVK